MTTNDPLDSPPKTAGLPDRPSPGPLAPVHDEAAVAETSNAAVASAEASAKTTRIFRKDWLRDFYRECGREVTLAYTTLNQMKNWAIVIDGAIIAAIVSIARSTVSPGDAGMSPQARFAVFAGASIALVFTLRFFVRAMMCYNNLVRWNRLQEAIVRARVMPGNEDDSALDPDADAELEQRIRLFYFEWRSPLTRSGQLLHNLKLGFALLFVLPLPFIIWGAITQWDDTLVRGITVFVIAVLGAEAWDFLGSSFFDDENAAERRSKKKPDGHSSVFPLPPLRWGYVGGLFLAAALATVVTFWPSLWARIERVRSSLITEERELQPNKQPGDSPVVSRPETAKSVVRGVLRADSADTALPAGRTPR